MRILIALPALNEEARLGGVLSAIPSEIAGASRVDVLVVDDGSQDATADVAREHGAEVVRHRRNRGVGRAFRTALEEALRRRVDVLVTLDADGQFDPQEIASLVKPIVAGSADFVTGTRFSGGQHPDGMPGPKLWGNRMLARFLGWITKEPLSDVSCGFRAYSREALLNLNLFGRFTYTQETILDLAFKELRIDEVPISVRYLPDRTSRVAGSLVRYALGALAIIVRTGRDFRPMRFFGTLGLVVFGLGVALDLALLGHYLATGSFTPYKFVGVAGLALNLAGILVLGMALLSDMLDRMRVNQERILYQLRRDAYDAEPTERDDPR